MERGYIVYMKEGREQVDRYIINMNFGSLEDGKMIQQ